MCWMTLGFGPDALAQGVVEARQGEKRSGGHSWGTVYVEDGEFHVQKGVGEIPDDIKTPYTDNGLVHTRYATRGEINRENAHPFPVYDSNGKEIAYLAHNGTWYGAPDDERCDSYHIAKLLESMCQTYRFEEALERTVTYVGETVTVLHFSGTGYVYSGRFDITEKESRVSSSGYQPIPDGQILKINESGNNRLRSFEGDSDVETARNSAADLAGNLGSDSQDRWSAGQD